MTPTEKSEEQATEQKARAERAAELRALVAHNQAQPFTEEELRAERARAVAQNRRELPANQAAWRRRLEIVERAMRRKLRPPTFASAEQLAAVFTAAAHYARRPALRQVYA